MPESWSRPSVPDLPGAGHAPHLHDTATNQLLCSEPNDVVARLYVCGITPYDATHIGHANTYLAFDTLQRAWLDAGGEVHYAQNITDVDDPLLERAVESGVDWRELADRRAFRTYILDGVPTLARVIHLCSDGTMILETEDHARRQVSAPQVVLGEE